MNFERQRQRNLKHRYSNRRN